jgi:hypothetical protein
MDVCIKYEYIDRCAVCAIYMYIDEMQEVYRNQQELA